MEIDRSARHSCDRFSYKRLLEVFSWPWQLAIIGEKSRNHIIKIAEAVLWNKLFHLLKRLEFLKFKGEHCLANSRPLLNIRTDCAMHPRGPRLDNNSLSGCFEVKYGADGETPGSLLHLMATLTLMLGNHTLDYERRGLICERSV